jgi:hypothetical protein
MTESMQHQDAPRFGGGTRRSKYQQRYAQPSRGLPHHRQDDPVEVAIRNEQPWR